MAPKSGWATFHCPKCKYRTTQPAAAEVTHPCGAGKRKQTLRKDDR